MVSERDDKDVTQQQWQPGQVLPLPLPVAAGVILHPPCGTTTARVAGLGNSAGLKITFSFAELFLTRISSPVRVTM